MELLAALTLGFFGSLHCIGMCGPLAAALMATGTPNGRPRIVGSSLLYNLGRVTTYATLGLFFGLLGSAARLAGWQQFLSIATGIIILLWLLLPKAFTRRLALTQHTAQAIAGLKLKLSSLLRSHRFAAHFGVGLLNGLLPCGFVYLALAGALAQPRLVDSVMFMALFGMGTMPALLAITLPNGFIAPSARLSLRRLMPIATALVAILLIVRGLALDIPYLSPRLSSAAQTVAPACHSH